MEEAGFINLVRTILILVLIYYAFKFIARLLFPLLFKKMMHNVEKKFSEQQQQDSADQQNVMEGETVIDKTPQKSSKINDNTGEYIDYEEVE